MAEEFQGMEELSVREYQNLSQADRLVLWLLLREKEPKEGGFIRERLERYEVSPNEVNLVLARMMKKGYVTATKKQFFFWQIPDKYTLTLMGWEYASGMQQIANADLSFL